MNDDEEIERLRRELTRLNIQFANANPDAQIALSTEIERAWGELKKRLPDQSAPVPRGVTPPLKRPGGTVMSAATGFDVEIRLKMESIPTGLVHLLSREGEPIVELAFKSKGGSRVRASAWIDGYSRRAIHIVELKVGDNPPLKLLPCFDPAAIRGLTTPVRAALRVRVEDLGGSAKVLETDTSLPVWLLPPTTAYLSVTDPSNGGVVDMTPTLAAWVTPSQPCVFKLLRDAADHHPDKQIVGYQGELARWPAIVRQQVCAIWDALRARNLRYVNSVFAYTAGMTTISQQRVRLPRESLEQSSANCIDGVVLLASLLEAASLRAAIVVIPSHAFLAYAEDPDGKSWKYVETTMLATSTLDDAIAQGQRLWDKWQAAAKFHDVFKLRLERSLMPIE